MLSDRPKRCILAVDDGSAGFASLAEAIRQLRPAWDLRTAAGADAARELGAVRTPEVCIVDLSMPNVDGCAFIAELRGDQRFRATRFLVLTSSSSDADLERAFESGASAFLPKPVNPEEEAFLLQRVDHLLGGGASDSTATGVVSGHHPDLRLLKAVKSCLRNEGRARRSTVVSTIVSTVGCDRSTGLAHIAGLIENGYVDQVGFGDDADIYPGHNLSSMVMRAFVHGQTQSPPA